MLCCEQVRARQDGGVWRVRIIRSREYDGPQLEVCRVKLDAQRGCGMPPDDSRVLGVELRKNYVD